MKTPIAHTLWIAFALATVGCSATKDEVTKQLEEVKQEITSLRAANSTLKDRLDILEASPAAARVDEAAPSTESTDRPSLEVVHLSPEEAPAPPTAVVAPIDDRPALDIVGDDTGVEQIDPTAPADPKAKSAAKAYSPKKRGR